MDGNPKRFKKSEESEENPVVESNNNMAAPSTSLQSPQGKTEEKQNGHGEGQVDSKDPFAIKRVLETVLRNLPTDQLKGLRLVNKLWDSVASSILQEDLPPIVFSDEFFDAEKMLKIVQTFRSSKNLNPPYVKFDLASKFFTQENEDLISDFFRVCGPFMQYLTISTDKNRDSRFNFAEVLFTTVKLPQLKSLVFEDHTPSNGVQSQYNHDFSKFFKALINAASNLERLDLSFPKRFFDTDEEEVAQLHQIPDGIICSKSSQSLKHLEISAKITDGQLQCLARTGLKLRTLHFRVKNVSLQESSFTALLESQSDTLLELKLTEERHGSDFLVRFPRMNELEKITIISICEFENSIVTFAPFGYQEHLPRMESLNLWNCFGKEERWSQFFLASSPSLTVTRLELPTQFRNPRLARNISGMFPALKRLKIGFSLRPENEDVMRIVFATMSNLEELDIRTDMDEMNENIDHVLTGLSRNVCRQLKADRSYLDPNCLSEVERGPSLVDLKNLKRLDIVLDNNRAPFITDVAGYLAFLEMPKLKILRFTRYGMSQECVAALQAKYRIEFIPPHGRNFFEMEYINLDDFE